VDDTVNAQSSTSSSSSTPRNKRLVPGAKSRQVYVNGYDVDGHATVIYTPTNEATCSIDDCVLYLVSDDGVTLFLMGEKENSERIITTFHMMIMSSRLKLLSLA
jgi:hypothetical protein